jgi:hypothetical protein
MNFRVLAFTSSLLLVGCSPGDPQARTALDHITPPTSNGAQAWSIAVRNLNDPVTIAGDCDKRALDMEYSLDGSHWIRASSLSGADSDCADGRFSFAVPSLFAGFPPGNSAQQNLQVRHVFKSAKGTPALVTVNYSVSHPRLAKGLRVVLGSLEGGTSATRVKLRIYARGKVQ